MTKFQELLKKIFEDEAFIYNVCLSKDHRFGMPEMEDISSVFKSMSITKEQKEQIVHNCKEFMRAILNNIGNAKDFQEAENQSLNELMELISHGPVIYESLETEVVTRMPKHAIEFEIGQTVYLKTDPDQSQRIVSGIKLRPGNAVIYDLAHGANESSHYGIEISNSKNYSI